MRVFEERQQDKPWPRMKEIRSKSNKLNTSEYTQWLLNSYKSPWKINKWNKLVPFISDFMNSNVLSSQEDTVTYGLQVQAGPYVPWVTGKKCRQRSWFQRPAATYLLLRVEPAQHRWEAPLAAHQDPTRFSWSTETFPDAHAAEVVASHSSLGAHGKALPLQLLMRAGVCGPTSANESWGSSPAERLQERNTNRKKPFFLLGVLRPVSSHGWTPQAPTPAGSCACTWCQKLRSVQTASRGRGKTKRQAVSSRAGRWKDPGPWVVAASSVHSVSSHSTTRLIVMWNNDFDIFFESFLGVLYFLYSKTC